MNSETMMKKITTGKARFWVRVFAVGIVFSVTAFLILVDMSKEYKASALILVTSKTEAASLQLGRITWNISEFPKMLSFYDRLLKSSPEMKDEFAGKSRDEKKMLWSKKIEAVIEESGEGSIIRISVFSKTSVGAESLLKKSTRNLFEVASGFYDAKGEISLNMVDGPFVSAVSRKSIPVTLLSIAIGFSASLMLNMFIGEMERFLALPRRIPKISIGKKSKEFAVRKGEGIQKTETVEEGFSYDVPYSFENIETYAEENKDERDPKAYDEMSEELQYAFKENPYPNYPEMPSNVVKYASAPENLPIAEEDILEQENTDEEVSFIEMKRSEPTDEELKDRLNKLLRGES